MTEDAQRIAIAQWCGWQWYRIPNSENYSRGPLRCLFLPAIHEYEGQSPAWLVKADGTERICNMSYMERDGHVADYLHDLNAMHDAESRLHGRELIETWNDNFYRPEVKRIIGLNSDDIRDWPAHASAAHRAEVLLRTLNLWVEDK
jgi:hypothetical protein